MPLLSNHRRGKTSAVPHSSAPRWRSVAAAGCLFPAACPWGCGGTSRAAAPPWWCLLPGSWFDWPPGNPPPPAGASLPAGETKRFVCLLTVWLQIFGERWCRHVGWQAIAVSYFSSIVFILFCKKRIKFQGPISSHKSCLLEPGMK